MRVPTACALALGALVVAGAAAEANSARTLLNSDHPYWDVGVMDPDLGRLCAMGKFNEIEMNRFVARFNGPKGASLLGIAKGTGLNLRDPGHKALKSEDYFFYQDGSSSCSVYVGGRTKPK